MLRAKSLHDVRIRRQSSSTTSPRSGTAATTRRSDPFKKTVNDRLVLMKTIIHAADISGQVYPLKMALKWGNLVRKEFAYQSMLEKSENLPETFSSLDDPLMMVEGQLFLARRLVLPLWELLPKIYPVAKPCLEHLRKNITYYEHEADRLRRSKQSAQVEDSNPGRAVKGLASGVAAKFVSFRIDPTAPERIDGAAAAEIDADLIDETVDG